MKNQEIALYPIHFSIYGKPGFRPRDMEKATLDRDSKDALTKVALSIFADCSNVGVCFHDAILAVYLSGLHHGSSFK